jgi:hypothetical protein
MRIDTLLSRRTDLSTFLVHLTRAKGDVSAKDRLKSILTQQRLIAESPFGASVTKLGQNDPAKDSQRCVCFTETPLEHVNLMLGEIEDRAYQFQPYGVAISKKQGRRCGVNPVWYVDITPGHHWLMNEINSLIDEAIEAGNFAESHIARIAPFVEQMGSGAAAVGDGGYRKEFWWEREWRFNGNLPLPGRFLVLCPQAEILEFQEVVENMPKMETYIRPQFIDPLWGLEKIIGFLAGIGVENLGPM